VVGLLAGWFVAAVVGLVTVFVATVIVFVAAVVGCVAFRFCSSCGWVSSSLGL